MIWAPYFERNTIISTTCVVRYAYICADVAIIEDYCYARCLPVSRAAPHYRCSQPSLFDDGIRTASARAQKHRSVAQLTTTYLSYTVFGQVKNLARACELVLRLRTITVRLHAPHHPCQRERVPARIRRIPRRVNLAPKQ